MPSRRVASRADGCQAAWPRSSAAAGQRASSAAPSAYVPFALCQRKIPSATAMVARPAAISVEDRDGFQAFSASSPTTNASRVTSPSG